MHRFLKPSFNTQQKTLLSIFPVQAGFPSPAEDYEGKTIDLNTHFIKHPASTFFVRVAGNSMIEKGIFPGDLLIVDKSLEAKNGRIVVAILNGEFTLKEFRQDKEKKILLVPANKDFPNIEIKMEDDFEVWGVVTSILRIVV
jgi:DNA polymerase V